MQRSWIIFMVVLAVSITLAGPPASALEVAGELFVDLDAAEYVADSDTWTNDGTLSDFVRLGEPQLVDIGGAPAVSFNSGLTNDSFQSVEEAPTGLVGADPTRTIEAWVYNPDITDEETIVAWGRRGGPAGTNMSFNYGINASYGALGQWGAGPDLGWLEIPEKGKWHYLVYTFDGTDVRVYSNGQLNASEFHGNGVLNTHSGPNLKINLAVQTTNDAGGLDFSIREGNLSIGRLRIHDEVLDEFQILENYDEERDDFPEFIYRAPVFVDTPLEETLLEIPTPYFRAFQVDGEPAPEVDLILPAANAILSQIDAQNYTLEYNIPDPAPESFEIHLEATSVDPGDNEENTAVARWTVFLVTDCGTSDELEVAERLLVDIDARDMQGGEEQWANAGCLGDFTKPVGANPIAEEVAGGPAVTFNGTTDAFVCIDDAPPSITGDNPTRSIEAWVYNPSILGEETIVSWGKRGGGCGTNMSFNYGTNATWGALGQWCGGPDLGWGVTPVAGQWHHLVYTYDGTTARVYADGVETNFELMGNLNTHPDTKIVIASQTDADGTTLTGGLKGSMSIGAIRVHDGVLTPEQIEANFLSQVDVWPAVIGTPEAPSIENAPEEATLLSGTVLYSMPLIITGNPFPDVALNEPAGATLIQDSPTHYTIEYLLPAPEPESFEVSVTASNDEGDTTASWTVTIIDCPEPPDDIEIAEQLFVYLDASDIAEDDTFWSNKGCLNDFFKIGAPVVEVVDEAAAVSFNGFPDAFQCFDLAPDGLVGLDPTRSIEAWAYNPNIAGEETMVAWGKRGGPCGTAMSFNYGTDVNFGAVTHWCLDNQDLGWLEVPLPNMWHHLVYTYDGETTRVYVDGVENNTELLGLGSVNTNNEGHITIAAQIEADGVTLNDGLSGTLSLGVVRVHDGVLTPEQITANFDAEKDRFIPPPPEPEKIPAGPVHRYSFEGDAIDSVGGADGVVFGAVDFLDGEAVLANDPPQGSNINGESPPGDPPGGYIDLPNGIISVLGNQATFETWTTWRGPLDSSWQRIFDFGTSAGGENWSNGAANEYYTFLTPRSGGNTLRCGFREGPTADERWAEFTTLPTDVEQHVVVVWDGASSSVSIFLEGLLVARNTDLHIALSDINDVNNWLGRSIWPDAMYNGSYEEFRIYDYALTTNQVLGNFEAGPDVVNTEIIIEGVPFVRADANSDGTANISDASYILNWLFLGGPDLACLAAGDANSDDTTNISDASYILNFLFLGGPDIGPPNACGEEPLADEADCLASPACEPDE